MDKIYIHRGDCVVFADITDFLTFMIDSQLDLTNWKAEFHLCSIIKKYDDISSKVIKIILSAEETSLLKCGDWNAALVLIDANGHRKTITNTIPFVVTNEVVENHYQTIDLTIPQSSGVDVTLKVGVDYVTSVNGMTGDVYLAIPSIEGLATETQLRQGLNTKQDKGDYITSQILEQELDTKQPIGDYATKTELNTKQPKGNYALADDVPTLVSQLQNDSNYATQTDVLQAIASIPQFNLAIVETLPETGNKMTLYFVPKEGADNDVYNEYVWIEQTGTFEFLGSTAVDLTDYVKRTDYATNSTGGVFKSSDYYASRVDSEGFLVGSAKTLTQYTNNLPNSGLLCKGTLENIKDDYVKRGLTANNLELTDDEKASARSLIGAIGNTDYAGDNAGVVKVSSANGLRVFSNGYIAGFETALNKYDTFSNSFVVCKGTLDTILTQYSKTVSLTEADYDSLETKDSNTLYLIEE